MSKTIYVIIRTLPDDGFSQAVEAFNTHDSARKRCIELNHGKYEDDRGFDIDEVDLND